jgi:hypothetical protein
MKRKHFTEDGGKAVALGARKKVVSIHTPTVSSFDDGRPPRRRSAAVAAAGQVRKMQRDDHVELSMFGSHEKGAGLECARDKAHFGGGEVLDNKFSRVGKVAMDGDYEDDAELPSPVKLVAEGEDESPGSIWSMRTEMNVNGWVSKIKGSWEETTHQQRLRAHHFVKEVVQECCSRICPNDTSTMQDDILRGLEPPPSEQKLLQTIGTIQSRLPKNSVQRSVLVAAMCSSQTRTAAQKYISPLGHTMFTRARENAGFLVLGHDLEVLIPPPPLQCCFSVQCHAALLLPSLHNIASPAHVRTTGAKDNATNVRQGRC